MKIFSWTAPRRYGLYAMIFLTIAWIAFLFGTGFAIATRTPLPWQALVVGVMCVAASGVLTVGLSAAVPEYWDELDELQAHKEAAKLAAEEYERARETLIRATLKEEYPTGEPAYREE